MSDFCVIHGFGYMKRDNLFDAVAHCEACEDATVLRCSYCGYIERSHPHSGCSLGFSFDV